MAGHMGVLCFIVLSKTDNTTIDDDIPPLVRHLLQCCLSKSQDRSDGRSPRTGRQDAARLDMIDEKRQSGVSLHINGLLGMGEALVLRGRGAGAALL